MARSSDESGNPCNQRPSTLRWEHTVAGWEFPNTRWSLVVNVARDEPRATEALEILCRTYWYPLYAYVRFRGVSPHDAQDLTQGFFEQLLSGDGLARADPEKGRLRSYLLGALKNFLAYQHRKDSAGKRGGKAVRISIDEEEAEIRLRNELAADPAGTPDRLFDRRWALMMLDRVLRQLESEHRAGGREDQFRVLSVFLARNSGSMRYAEAAEQLGATEGSVKVAVHRMRKRYREILHREILATVSSPEEVDEEIESLFAVLG